MYVKPSSYSFLSARSCPWGLRGQQLKIEPPHIMVRHHFQRTINLLSQMLTRKN